MVVFSSWRKPSFLGPKTLFISLGGILRHIYFYRKSKTSPYGAFSRSVTLPSGLNTDGAEATFDNGILTLTIPKVEKVKPKQIKVKAKGVIEGKK